MLCWQNFKSMLTNHKVIQWWQAIQYECFKRTNKQSKEHFISRILHISYCTPWECRSDLFACTLSENPIPPRGATENWHIHLWLSRATINLVSLWCMRQRTADICLALHRLCDEPCDRICTHATCKHANVYWKIPLSQSEALDSSSWHLHLGLVVADRLKAFWKN